MVTLLGFMFIVGNVMLIEVYMPDLIGPVRHPCRVFPSSAELSIAGSVLVVLQFRIGNVDVSRPRHCFSRINSDNWKVFDAGQR